MEDMSGTRVYEGDSIVRIIAGDKLISNDMFEWNGVDEFGGWITLGEISRRLRQLGYEDVYYVWEDTPLRGTIYQYGNYRPECWEEYGKTKGYA
ncbi:hypothetical protein [Brevibacillus formosus]|uniref:hypothetical protein n=1 Tax=Brevibacillus formosus TaxID=54913 RepID=UPI003F1B02C2